MGRDAIAADCPAVALMQKPGGLKKPLQPGTLRKDRLQELCTCPSVPCMVHGVVKKPALASPVTGQRAEDYKGGQGH